MEFGGADKWQLTGKMDNMVMEAIFGFSRGCSTSHDAGWEEFFFGLEGKTVYKLLVTLF